jgi:hypothetical protein
MELTRSHELTLVDLADRIRSLLAEVESTVWQIGELLSLARRQLPGDREFGQWCNTNFVEHTNTLRNMRLLHETFGDRKEEVTSIPQSSLYALAAPSAAPYREQVLRRLQGCNKVSGVEVESIIEEVREEQQDAFLSQAVERESFGKPERYQVVFPRKAALTAGELKVWLQEQPDRTRQAIRTHLLRDGAISAVPTPTGTGGASPTPSLQPKDLKIVPIEVDLACKLNALWHSRLPRVIPSNITRNRRYACYAAEHEGIHYAVGIWSDPVAANRMADGDRILELRRLAINAEAPPNTASRMLRVMVKLIRKQWSDLVRVISYQDNEVHKGTIYKAAGWTLDGEAEFVDWGATRKRNAAQTTASKTRWSHAWRS